MNRRMKEAVPVIVAATALILLYAGLFLFGRNPERSRIPENSTVAPTTAATVNQAAATVKHIQLAQQINGKVQQINILEYRPGVGGIRLVPVLSHDLVYGYETLSSMVQRKNAYAGINAGFFYDYGIPSGMVAVDGQIYTLATGKYPVFTIENEKAALGNVQLEMQLEFGGGKVQASRLNKPPAGKSFAVFTPVYGATNRLEGENYTISVRNGVVVEAGLCQDATEIPEDGLLISYVGDISALTAQKNVGAVSLLSLKKGDQVKLSSDPALSPDFQAYECGSWVVRDGKVVIGKQDAWIGVTTNNDPRTVIGIKKDGTVVLLTVDGRQPGYSEGMTCQELGTFLLEYGIDNAAMLDGGASTEMIVDGKMINRPSHKGEERPLGGGLLLMKD